MNVGIVGNGGREAALEYCLRQSPLVKTVQRLKGDPDDTTRILHDAHMASIDLTIVGPEMFLAKGIVNLFRSARKLIVGPTRAASRIETSKVFCKELLKERGVPIPGFRVFNDAKKAKDFLSQTPAPVVIKADGLASGKGVTVARTQGEGLQAVDTIMATEAGKRILIEEYLQGKECSFMVITDGEHVIPLLAARDYKEAYPGGPNTGGMGCIAPIPEMTESLEKEILKTIIQPTLLALKELGCPFQGILYAGLMLTPRGPKVLEFNCRLGDPEWQTLTALLDSDIFPPLLATTDGTCSYRRIEWKNQSAVCVVLASEGYPGTSKTGFPIYGLEKAEKLEDVLTFHAGMSRQPDGSYVTNGGRVLNVVGTGRTLTEARQRAYEAVNRISFEGMWYRKDIGL